MLRAPNISLAQSSILAEHDIAGKGEGGFMHSYAKARLISLIMLLFGLALSAGARAPIALAAGTPAAGYAVSDYATGLPNFGPNGVGPVGLIFDSTNHLLVGDYYNGYLYKFSSSGQTASANGIGYAANQVAGLSFDQSGRLYAAIQTANEVVEISPTTGAILRVVASNLPCATGLATDPLSGDLFVTGGGNCTPAISRISNYQAGPGVVSVFYSGYIFDGTHGGAIDGITFGPDGTIYGALYRQGPVKITRSSSGGLGSLVFLANIPSVDGIAIAENQSDPSQPPFIYTNDNDGTIERVDLTASPPAITTIVSGGSRGDFITVGPDRCLYASQTSSVERLTQADGNCNLAPNPVVPQLSLAPLSQSATTGTAVTLSATLTNVASPSGVSVNFTVSGPNARVGTASANSSGMATFTYTGTSTGLDTVQATATASGVNVTSNPATVSWSQPADSTAPTCALASVIKNASGQTSAIQIAVQDPDGGLASIAVTELNNATADVGTYQTGITSTPTVVTITDQTTGVVTVTADKVDLSSGASIALTAKDVAGNSVSCDPVAFGAVRANGAPVTQQVAGVGQADNKLTVINDGSGEDNLTVSVNSHTFKVNGLMAGQRASLDISGALTPGVNQVSVTLDGKPGSSAAVLFGNI